MQIDLARGALASLRAHPARTLLTLAGVVWGTALVILLITWGAGLRDTLVEQVSAGGRRMMVFFGGRSTSGVGANRGGHAVRLTRADCTLVASQLPSLEHVTCAAIRWGGVYVHYRSDHRSVTTFGVDPEAARVMALHPDEGRFVDAHDVVQRRRVAVVGADLKRQLFGSGRALGERIEVNGIGYTVVGVLRRKGDQIASLGPADDQKLFIPVTTFQALVSGDDTVAFVGVSPRVAEEHRRVELQVRKVLAARHGFDPADREALAVFDVLNFVDLFRNLMRAVHFFVTVLGVVTLAIGGVGIMNVLILSVTERTPEIGLRRAMGATRRAIVVQFLVEALCTTALGGLVGIGLGVLLCLTLGTQGPVHVPAFLRPATVVFSAGLLVAIGLAAGLWPAVRASRVDPVTALRFQ